MATYNEHRDQLLRDTQRRFFHWLAPTGNFFKVVAIVIDTIARFNLAHDQVKNARALNRATAHALDQWGETLGVGRHDQESDTDYRKRLETECLIQNSHGTIEEIKRILSRFAVGDESGMAQVSIQNNYDKRLDIKEPATMIVSIPSDWIAKKIWFRISPTGSRINNSLRGFTTGRFKKPGVYDFVTWETLLRRIAPAGVKVNLHVFGNSFRLSPTGVRLTSSTRGLNQGIFGGVSRIID